MEKEKYVQGKMYRASGVYVQGRVCEGPIGGVCVGGVCAGINAGGYVQGYVRMCSIGSVCTTQIHTNNASRKMRAQKRKCLVNLPKKLPDIRHSFHGSPLVGELS